METVIQPVREMPVRETLGRIWLEVLKLDNPPADADDFFDLGGDSLAMVWLLSMTQDRLGADLSVEEMFEESFDFAASVRAVRAAVEATGAP